MDKKILASTIIVAAVIVVVGVAFSVHHATPAVGSSVTTTAGVTNTSKILFSSTQYFPYSYQISPGPISAQAQAALTGFNLTSTTLQNGTTKVTIALMGTSSAQSVLLKPNYRLYIVETTYGDDGYHFDSSLGDDGFVVVDPSGYIAQ